MVRISVTVTADDAGEAAMILRDLVAKQVDEGYLEGSSRNESSSYRYDVQEYNNG